MSKAMPKIDRTCVFCKQTFQGTARANYCPGCRPINGQAARRKYVIDERVQQLLRDRYDSGVKGRAAEIAAELGWPTFAVKKAAKKLGLTRPWPADRRDWTAEQIDFLKHWTGLRSARWIGQRMRRGETSVILKMRRLSLERRVRYGYTIRDVGRCFGVDHRTVDRWLAQGWLVGQPQGTARPNEILRIEESAILRFILQHREEFRLATVDQAWFLHLVLDGPRSAKQLVAAGRPGAEGRVNGRRQTSQERAEEKADREAPSPAKIAQLAAEIRREGNGDSSFGRAR